MSRLLLVYIALAILMARRTWPCFGTPLSVPGSPTNQRVGVVFPPGEISLGLFWGSPTHAYTPGTRPARPLLGRRTLGKTVSGTDLGRPDEVVSRHSWKSALDTLCVARNRG
jgi:hypothetical protein